MMSTTTMMSTLQRGTRLLNPSKTVTLASSKTSSIHGYDGVAGTRLAQNHQSEMKRHFSSSRTLAASIQDKNHYEVLGIPRSATRIEIKDKFYELSRKFHPDAPSVSSESVEIRTARFQTLSQSYSVLSDDTSRRQYDSTLFGGSGSRFGSSRPRYTSGAAHEVGRSGFGGGAGAAWSWTSGENQARRERANYAWAHPTNRSNRKSSSAQDEAEARSDPFNKRREPRSSDEYFQTFAAREARMRGRSAASGAPFGSGSRFASGTASFGAKAEEESRLINDSSTKRTGQVFFVFAATFFLAWSLSDSHRNAPPATNHRRRT